MFEQLYGFDKLLLLSYKTLLIMALFNLFVRKRLLAFVPSIIEEELSDKVENYLKLF